MNEAYDVMVAGGGNAALCAALTAAEQGARVIILESAPRDFRGGNSRHTRNMRSVMAEYSPDEYFNDLLRVTGGQTDEALAKLAIESSPEAMEWMRAHGVRFQPALEGTMQLGRTNAFFLGGGKALLNSYYKVAEARGIRVLYNAEVTDLNLTSGIFESATVRLDGEPTEIRARAFVAASGGFEANLGWLKEAWGECAENFLIRGTPYNKGKVLRLLLDAGAESAGDPVQCHAVAIDARAPKFDGGIVTRLDSLPLGIVVNNAGERFYDEGEDLWPKRYAIWGRLVGATVSRTPSTARGWSPVSHWSTATSRVMPAFGRRPATRTVSIWGRCRAMSPVKRTASITAMRWWVPRMLFPTPTPTERYFGRTESLSTSTRRRIMGPGICRMRWASTIKASW